MLHLALTVLRVLVPGVRLPDLPVEVVRDLIDGS